MVVKALSWALRSLVEWDRNAVAEFVQEHDDVLAARVKREVGSKLRTGRKNAIAGDRHNNRLQRTGRGAARR
jgi:hypothetical protein